MVQTLSCLTYKMFQELKTFPLEMSSSFEKVINRPGYIETINDAYNYFLEAYRQFDEIINELHANKKNNIVKWILDYIKTNYTCPSLCPDTIASELGLSTNYIRRLFKLEFGVNLSEYILSIRIAKIKQLIVSSSRPIKDIYGETGFGNYNYFFTAFKKNTGLTPAQFRLREKIK